MLGQDPSGALISEHVGVKGNDPHFELSPETRCAIV